MKLALAADRRPPAGWSGPAQVMGIVNVTPDSFSDGGDYLDAAAAIAHGEALAAAGADILDIGGEATNPRAEAVTAEVELARVLPVIRGLAARLPHVRLSIDTTKAAVAIAAAEAGALIINDVSGGLFDPAMADALAQLPPTVIYIAGHLRGSTLREVFAAERPVTWQEVAAELTQRLAALPAAVSARAWIDPGLGFGKGDTRANFDLINHAGDLRDALDRPVVIGASRKRFLRFGSEKTLAELDQASAVMGVRAVRQGANIVRTHNVALLRQLLAVYTKR